MTLQEGMGDYRVTGSPERTVISDEGPGKRARAGLGGSAAAAPDPLLSLLVLAGLGLACLLVMSRGSPAAEKAGDRPWLLSELSVWPGTSEDAEGSQYEDLRGPRGFHPNPPSS
ncbi:MAG: hypothetical protein SCH98_15510 [Deferrisomatales bacterium]|nr:hypothetical protein [Deferrisomatales bacterium]